MRPLPKFEASKKYWLGGGMLNELMAAIAERTPIAGPGLVFTDSPRGRILKLASASTADVPTWSFKPTWSTTTPGEITVAAGNVFSPLWVGTLDNDDPEPINWTEPFPVTSTDVAVADGEGLWLYCTLTKKVFNSRGPFPNDGGGPPTPPEQELEGVSSNYWVLDDVGFQANASDYNPGYDSDTIFFVHLCDVVGTKIIHRHLGDVYLHLPFIAFVNPDTDA